MPTKKKIEFSAEQWRQLVEAYDKQYGYTRNAEARKQTLKPGEFDEMVAQQIKTTILNPLVQQRQRAVPEAIEAGFGEAFKL